MITLITGVPGSGKTAGAVDLLLKEYKDRPLYVDGLADLQLEHESLDVMAWHMDVPDGAVIVVDEVQRKWRPRGPGSKVPESVAALETHRHRGLDFVIITQNPKLLDSNVRSLVGRHVHIRDTGFLGRWAYEWPECNPDLAWARCQNKRRYKLPKRVFDLYKSASMHTKPVRKVPPMLYIVGALLIAVAALLLYFKSTFNPTGKSDLPVTSLPPGQTTPNLSPLVVASETPAASFIDDRVDFIPRVSNRPESAPAYDHIRQIVNMPQVTGGMCVKGACRCFTQQGTNAGLSMNECKEWMDSRTFDHYRSQVTDASPARGGIASVNKPLSQDRMPSAPERIESIPLPSGFSNPRADATPPSIFPPGSPIHTTPSTGEVQSIAPPNLLNPYRRS